ncbi:uncharacterized protein LOC143288576 [Babylonia areolata]|uniref:uncharacterized protein LOC143288576 n=1 Tax=Babylonia areolata TaxID=304850 RepID=UPI003FD6A567
MGTATRLQQKQLTQRDWRARSLTRQPYWLTSRRQKESRAHTLSRRRPTPPPPPLTASLTPFHLQDTYLAEVTLHATQPGQVMKVEVTAVGVDSSVMGHLHVAELRMPLSFHHVNTNTTTSTSTSSSGMYVDGRFSALHTFLSPYGGDVHVQVVVEGPAEARVTARLSRCLHTVPSTSSAAVTLRQTSAYSVSVCSHVRDPESGLRALMVGVGTTPGGLQLRPWVRVGYSGHVSLDLEHVQHKTTLYAAVIAQNHAGQWSRFVSEPVLFDRTGPEVSDVTLTLRYQGQGQGQGQTAEEVRAEGRWRVQDAESGVEVCTCRVDGQGTVQSILTPAVGEKQGLCQWPLSDAHHGSEVTLSVTCHNAVQLVTTVTSLPVTVLLRPPVVAEVTLGSRPNNVYMSPYDRSTPQVRSGNSSLEFFWQGVEDPTVLQFYFRFLRESSFPSEWSSLDAYKTTAVLPRLGKESAGSDVTAQLMAVNARNMTSEALSVTVRLDDASPRLTGKTATWSLNEQRLSIDWRHVFEVTRDVTYVVFAGTQEGYGDVINHVTTGGTTHYEGYYPKALAVMYVSIQAVYDNGLSAVYTDFLVM